MKTVDASLVSYRLNFFNACFIIRKIKNKSLNERVLTDEVTMTKARMI